MQGALKKSIWLLFLCALFYAQGALRYFTIPRFDAAFPPAPSEERAGWNPELVRFFSFGFTQQLVDWLWLRFLQEDSITHVRPDTRAGIYYDLGLMTDLDPANYPAYVTGSQMLSIIRNDNWGALQLLLKGERAGRSAYRIDKFWSPPWLLPLMLGYVYLYEFGNIPEASRRFTEAGTMPGAPEFLVRLGARFATPEGPYEVAERVLRVLLYNARNAKGAADLKQAQALEQKIANLEVVRELALIRRTLKEQCPKSPDLDCLRRLAANPGKHSLELSLREGEVLDRFGGKLFFERRDGAPLLKTSTPHEPVMGLE